MAPVEALLRVFGAPRTRPVPLKLGGLLCTIWVDTAAEHALGDLLAALAPTGPAETGGPATAPALRYVAVRLDGEPEHGRWLLLTDQALPVVLTPERDRFISEVSDHLLALGATHSTSDAWFRFSVLTRGNRAILVQAEYLFDRVALNDLLTTSGWVLGSCEYVAIGADGTVRLPRQAREQPGYLPSGVILGFSETSLPPIQQQALAVWACCIHGALGFEPLRLDHETTVDRTVALLSGCPLTGTFGFAAPALMDAVQRLTESGEVT